MATALPVATTTTSTKTGTAGDEANRSVKAMEKMSIQTNEMNKLKDKLTSLETDCRLSQIMHKEEKKRLPEWMRE